MTSFKNLNFLTSFKFFSLIILIIFILFNFLDVYLFKLSRSFHGIFFSFFKNIVDPISDILDPLNLIIFCLLILLFNANIRLIIKNHKKCEIIKSKTNFSIEKINDLFAYISLVCKHFILSLGIAGILCNVLKYFLGVSRPKYFFLEGYDRFDFFNIEHKVNSFPSGHTQAAFTFALLIIIYSRRYFIFIIIIAVLMGLSRIFMSMHFPSDLVSGAYLGSIIPVLLYKYNFKDKIDEIKKKHKVLFRDIMKLMFWRLFI